MKDREMRNTVDAALAKLLDGSMESRTFNGVLGAGRYYLSTVGTGLRVATSKGKGFDDEYFESDQFIAKPRKSRK